MTLLLPGVDLQESSLTSTITSSLTGTSVIVGKFIWGPVNKILQVISEPDLVSRFGKPDNLTADLFFSLAGFLSYGNDLRLVRIVNPKVASNALPLFNIASATISTAGSGYSVNDKISILLDSIEVDSGYVSEVSTTGEILLIVIPTSVIIEMIESGAVEDETKFSLKVISQSGTGAKLIDLSLNKKSGIYIPNDDMAEGKLPEYANLALKYKIPAIVAKYPGEFGNSIKVAIVSYADFVKSLDGTIELTCVPSGIKSKFNIKALFEYGPESVNQYAVVTLIDDEVAESKILSSKKGDKDIYGSSIYIDDYFNKGSLAYIQGTAFNWPKGFSGVLELSGGISGNDTITAGNWIEGWDNFSDKENITADLFIGGSCAGEGVKIASTVQKAVSLLTDGRSDSVAFCSPPKELVVNKSAADATTAIIEWRNGKTSLGAVVEDNLNVNSTYTFIDGNYAYIYDKYNDVNRWVPLAGYIAGLCAYTDNVANSWTSPAGPNRGIIKNIIKLAIETRTPHRDRLYAASINPVVGFAGVGFLLYGDKTATSKLSPFDRINVRRLFNMLKRNLSNSAFYKLFENNDYFTRYSYRTEATTYMDYVKNLGGMYDYRIQCDENNNTGQVIDSNQFVALFWIKPTKSINFIKLNLMATATSANFDELVTALNNE